MKQKAPRVRDNVPAYHAMSAPAVLDLMGLSSTGLSAMEARARFDKFGPNTLPQTARRGALARFAAQFHNVLIYVLIGAGVVTAALGHWVDAAVIVGVVLINAIIGFVQEGKAEHALEAIRDMLPASATVLRDGHRQSVAAQNLVPGDVVYVESGDRVSADLRLLESKSLRIQEAALTGESVPVDKSPAAVESGAALGDRQCMAYSGTIVASGRGTGLVVATGADTELGHISMLLGQVISLTTPLLVQMAQFGRRLTAVILGVAVVVFGFGMLVRGYAAADMFLAGVGLAVAAIPEGLPAIMTITLALGVQRMARRNAIIRRLPAVETLGSVTVICSDKTGTLTRNEMMVQSVATSRNLYEVTGVGYVPRGDFLLDGHQVDLESRPLLVEMARGALLCSDATLREVDGSWAVAGDPTEGALVALAAKTGLEGGHEGNRWPRTDVIPFESEHAFMATLHHADDGQGAIYVKGAPERLLRMATSQRSYDGVEPLDIVYWQSRLEQIGAHGQRVLALAMRDTDLAHRQLRFSDVESGLVFIGLFGLADPPREEAVVAVGQCRHAGIRVKMITGDHLGTARAIGTLLGLDASHAMTGSDLDAVGPEALPEHVMQTDVFARTSPEHKLRLVQALQSAGQVVAMTGDGVNDAPALKRADVGVAMGQKGTDAARESAEMVLADDNFASIAHAVEEGRTVYDNLRKAITFILPTNGGEAMVIVCAIAFGTLLPITPVQILWINMITAVTLALALAFERPESDVMRRPPRSPGAPLLSGFIVWRIVFVSLILVTGTFGLFAWERANGSDLEVARTVAVNTLVVFEAFYLLSCRSLRGWAFESGSLAGSGPAVLAIGLVLAFQLLFTYTSPFQLMFGTRPLDGDAWARIVLVAVSVLLLVEVEKGVLRHVNRRTRMAMGPRDTQSERP